MKEYISLGLDKEIVDPDKGANIARKLRALQSSDADLSRQSNLSPSPVVPDDGWTSNLAALPTVTYDCLYKHFERMDQVMLDTRSSRCALRRHHKGRHEPGKGEFSP